LLNHVALVCSSEKNSDLFYSGLLGLNKTSTKVLAPELSKKIFDIDGEFKMINYANDYLRIEIFIDDQYSPSAKHFGHICLEMKDLDRFIEKCKTMQVDVKIIAKDGYQLVFIKDYDGNLFEIKELRKE